MSQIFLGTRAVRGVACRHVHTSTSLWIDANQEKRLKFLVGSGKTPQKMALRARMETPPALALHLIVDNSSTPKSPLVKRWLKRHPRVHLHFTPTGSSWLNRVERWFSEITPKRIRRGTFGSVQELIAEINESL